MEMVNYYDIIAKGYNNLHGEEQRRKLMIILAYVQNINPNDFFLDVGCGTGISFQFINSEYKFGLDPSAELLKQVDKAKSYSGCVIKGQGECLPFRSCLFDVVLCLTAIHNFDNPKQAIREIFRVSKLNAIVIISVLKRSSKAILVSNIIKQGCVLQELDDLHDLIWICKNIKNSDSFASK